MAQQLLNIEYQDLKPEVLEFAKAVSLLLDFLRKFALLTQMFYS